MSSFDPQPSPEWETNPYAAPDADLGAPLVELDDTSQEAERVRREHINHEASVRSIGSLHILGAVFGVIGVIAGIVMALLPSSAQEQRIAGFVVAAIYVPLTALNIALGIGLRKLQVWARWTEAALLGAGLLIILGLMTIVAFVPAAPKAVLIVYGLLGLFYAYILHLLLSAKGSMVFSERYKSIVAQTPHVKYRTSLLVKIVVGLFVAVILLAVVGGIVGVLTRR